jgi:hypothetical protein
MAKITNNLLKQAIADAEAVRETAVANAKLVLEEAITPQIREMIARRLRVEAMEGEEEEKGHEMKKEAAVEKPFQDAEAEGGSEFPADTSTIGGGENKEPSDDSFDASGIGDGGENKEDSHTDWYDDWSESDFDLDEVIKELEEDIAALSEAEHEAEEKGEEEGGEEEGGEEESKEAPEQPKANPFAAKKEVTQDTHDADAQKFAKAPVAEDDMEAGDEEEIDLEEILAELEADDDEMAKPEMGGHGGETKQVADKLARLKSELGQYREAVNILRGRLNEVNLLNAKLLFTNKMFRNQGLTNEQKVRIVESFDRATTVREVKLVYTALVENLSTQAKTFNTTRKKVVAEGFASKAVPTTAPKKEVIVENTVAKRLQELAGIL